MDVAAVILWMVLIFGLSTEHLSSAQTAPFTTILFVKLIPGLAALDIDTIDLLVP
jgi:hypothetical protein